MTKGLTPIWWRREDIELVKNYWADQYRVEYSRDERGRWWRRGPRLGVVPIRVQDRYVVTQDRWRLYPLTEPQALAQFVNTLRPKRGVHRRARLPKTPEDLLEAHYRSTT